MPSPGGNASFRFLLPLPLAPSAILQCSPLLPPPPPRLRAPWVYGQGETGFEMTLGTDRGPTARETCVNLEILQNADRFEPALGVSRLAIDVCRRSRDLYLRLERKKVRDLTINKKVSYLAVTCYY